MSKTRYTGLIFAIIFAVAIILPGLVSAQDKVIELKYGSTYGPDHAFSMVDKMWIEKIEKRQREGSSLNPIGAERFFPVRMAASTN